MRFSLLLSETESKLFPTLVNYYSHLFSIWILAPSGVASWNLRGWLNRLFTVLYFSVGFSRLVHFDRTPAILVCNGGRNLGRVSKLLRGAGVGRRFSRSSTPTQRTLTRDLLGSLDTLPRLRSPLQMKMAGVRSKRTSLENPTEK